jgi:hypothetical protein
LFIVKGLDPILRCPAVTEFNGLTKLLIAGVYVPNIYAKVNVPPFKIERL